MISTPGPLNGIRILDFCWIGAGALVTKTLAELGAVVYRVESRTHPENLRLAPPYRPGTEGLEGSGYFASRNPSKHSVALNMATPEGRTIAARLAAQADVVASNFRPGVMARWGLSYDEVRAQNQDVVYLTMPMQGETGPHASYIGFGSTIAALAGLVGLSRATGRTPVGTGTHYPDHVPNPGHALVAVLAALRHRARTGQGQHVELAQLESTVSMIGPALIAAGAGQEPEPQGNRVDHAAPHGAYRCADGQWVVVECAESAHWRGLLRAFEADGERVDPRFVTHAGRKAHEDALDEWVAAQCERMSRAELLHRLRAAGVPSAAVKTSQDMVEDAELWARGFWQEIEHPVIGTMPISRTPFRRVGAPRPELVRPPLLGEHTFEVLEQELGFSRAECELLAHEKVAY